MNKKNNKVEIDNREEDSINKIKAKMKMNLFIRIAYYKYSFLGLFFLIFFFTYDIDWTVYTNNIMRNKVIAVNEWLKNKDTIGKFYLEEKFIPTVGKKLHATLKDGKKLTIEVYSDNYGMLLKKIVKIDGKIVSQKKYPPASKWEQLKMRWRSITILP